jgi:hypothetical protein
MADQYDVIFRGDVLPGHSVVAVRDNLKALFKLDDDRIAQMFTGRPVAIRRGIDKDLADRFRVAMEKSGAIVEIRPAPAAKTTVEATAPGRAEDEAATVSAPSFDVEPVGADVLKPGERQPVEAPAISTDHLSVEEPGADVLRPDERRAVPEKDIDTSHLSVEPEPRS